MYVWEHVDQPLSPVFNRDLSVVVALVVGAGLMSLISMALLSLDNLQLRVLAASGTEQEQRDAKRVMPLVKRHHWLLVTMLIINSGCVFPCCCFFELWCFVSVSACCLRFFVWPL